MSLENSIDECTLIEVPSDAKFTRALRSFYDNLFNHGVNGEEVNLNVTQTSSRGSICVRLGIEYPSGANYSKDLNTRLISLIQGNRYSILDGQLGVRGGVLRLEKEN